MISRALVAILLMMNLGVAAWWLWGPGPQESLVRDAAIAGVPTLQLLSEREPDVAVPAPPPVAGDSPLQRVVAGSAVDVPVDRATDVAASAPESDAIVSADETIAAAAAIAAAGDTEPSLASAEDAPADTAAAAPHCFSIGPFTAIDDVRRTSALIETSLQRQQVREVRSTEVRGYRVYLSPFPTRQEAMDAARALQEKGLRDYYVVTAGEQENTVSLGLFRDLANAESRREQVRGFGFEPRLEPRQQELTRWWLDIAVAADDTAWRQQATRYPGTRIESLACE